eukprot:gene6535-biopygen235
MLPGIPRTPNMARWMGVAVLAMGVAVLAMGVAVLAMGVAVLAMGVAVLAMGVAVLAMGIAMLAMGVAVLAMGVAVLAMAPNAAASRDTAGAAQPTAARWSGAATGPTAMLPQRRRRPRDAPSRRRHGEELDPGGRESDPVRRRHLRQHPRRIGAAPLGWRVVSGWAANWWVVSGWATDCALLAQQPRRALPRHGPEEEAEGRRDAAEEGEGAPPPSAQGDECLGAPSPPLYAAMLQNVKSATTLRRRPGDAPETALSQSRPRGRGDGDGARRPAQPHAEEEAGAESWGGELDEHRVRDRGARRAEPDAGAEEDQHRQGRGNVGITPPGAWQRWNHREGGIHHSTRGGVLTPTSLPRRFGAAAVRSEHAAIVAIAAANTGRRPQRSPTLPRAPARGDETPLRGAGAHQREGRVEVERRHRAPPFGVVVVAVDTATGLGELGGSREHAPIRKRRSFLSVPSIPYRAVRAAGRCPALPPVFVGQRAAAAGRFPPHRPWQFCGVQSRPHQAQGRRSNCRRT